MHLKKRKHNFKIRTNMLSKKMITVNAVPDKGAVF